LIRPRNAVSGFSIRIDAADTVAPLSGAAFAAIMTGPKVADGSVGIEVATGLETCACGSTT
jgi:hypothetical protein